MRYRTGMTAGALALRWAGVALALWGLNFALTFENRWPTPWITAGGAVSVEIALILLGLALVAEYRGPPSRRLIGALALLLILLLLGRYAEVTVPALYGRPVNLYWDGQHLPRVMAMLAEAVPAWWLGVAALAGVGGLLLLFLLLRQALWLVAVSLAARRWCRGLGGIAGGAVLVYLAGRAGWVESVSWFAEPAILAYGEQVRFLREALAARRAGVDLPENPPVVSDLGRLRGSDVFLVFLESYGAVAWTDAKLVDRLAPSRQRLREAIEGSGRSVVSALVESPTFGGNSWLAHISLLSGVEVRDPGTYERLIASDRETLVHRFSAGGYRAVALMPGLRRDWPEGGFYSFERIYGEHALDYPGPGFGWWRIPDQFALARLHTLEVVPTDRRPLFLFFTTISSHAPFRPTPPYQPDWSRMDSAEPYDPSDVQAAFAKVSEWADQAPAYGDTLDYLYRYLAGYLREQAPADLVMILLGDHQPPAVVAGAGADWAVPVHVIARDRALLDRLKARGFQEGLTPGIAGLGPLHRLRTTLLEVFHAGEGLSAGIVGVPESGVDVTRSGPGG